MSSTRPRVIVGMSTIPSRIQLIGPAIESLRNQSQPPDEIVLALPRVSLREGFRTRSPRQCSR